MEAIYEVIHEVIHENTRIRTRIYTKAALISCLFVFFFVLFSVLVFAPTARAQNIEIFASIPSVCGNAVAEFDEACDYGPPEDLRSRVCSTFGYSSVASSTLSCSLSCEFIFSSCLTDAEVLSTTTISAASGGTHIHTTVSGTQAIFDFPTNFYTDDLTLRAFSYVTDFFETTKPAPSGKTFVGKVFDFFLNDFFGAQAATLSKNGTVTIDYLVANIPSGFDENSLTVYRWNSSSSVWQEISGVILDTISKRVSFSTKQFNSSFAILASPVSAPEVPSGKAGGPSSIQPRPLLLGLPLKPDVNKCDFNDDGRCNIQDLSIMLYWWNKTGPEMARYDLKQDGIIDIADVSVLLYNWTG